MKKLSKFTRPLLALDFRDFIPVCLEIKDEKKLSPKSYFSAVLLYKFLILPRLTTGSATMSITSY
jgi:hypothetical protein